MEIVLDARHGNHKGFGMPGPGRLRQALPEGTLRGWNATLREWYREIQDPVEKEEVFRTLRHAQGSEMGRRGVGFDSGHLWMSRDEWICGVRTRDGNLKRELWWDLGEELGTDRNKERLLLDGKLLDHGPAADLRTL